MRCPECEHENTEGAWLCINCGAKLPRADVKDQSGGPDEVASPAPPQEPSRFAPQISENLRRLRDQTERARQRARNARSPRPARSRDATGPVIYFGFPLAAWALIGFVLIVIVFVMSQLQ